MSGVMHIVLRALAGLAIGFVVLLLTVWGALALWHQMPGPSVVRWFVIAMWSTLGVTVVLSRAGLLGRRNRNIAGFAFVIAAASLLMWWGTLQPSHQRVWADDVAQLLEARIDGNHVHLNNVRNFQWRSETDYTPAWYDKRFDLRKLQGVDLVAVYWMGPAIAHIFLSFDFGGGDHLEVSIETRKEKGEGYSTLKGFFRQYELYYVVADERDVIRLRTNYRRDPPEEVYVYRLQGDLDNARRLFLEYIQRINALHERPEFYNTLTTNCTTTIWMNTRVNASHLPFDWKILASGYLGKFLHQQGRLNTEGLPFAKLQQRAHVNARAQAADRATDFSRRIREVATLPPADLANDDIDTAQ
jgi:hypothetical protein